MNKAQLDALKEKRFYVRRISTKALERAMKAGYTVILKQEYMPRKLRIVK